MSSDACKESRTLKNHVPERRISGPAGGCRISPQLIPPLVQINQKCFVFFRGLPFALSTPRGHHVQKTLAKINKQ